MRLALVKTVAADAVATAAVAVALAAVAAGLAVVAAAAEAVTAGDATSLSHVRRQSSLPMTDHIRRADAEVELSALLQRLSNAPLASGCRVIARSQVSPRKGDPAVVRPEPHVVLRCPR